MRFYVVFRYLLMIVREDVNCRKKIRSFIWYLAKIQYNLVT